jgi:hypothetical protein
MEIIPRLTPRRLAADTLASLRAIRLLSILLKGGDVKMINDMQTTIEEYVRLYDAVKKHVSDSSLALAVLQEIRKDLRMQEHRQTVTNGDWPATENQIAYLRNLGAEIPEGLTRQQASQLIDNIKAAKGATRAVKLPLRVP